MLPAGLVERLRLVCPCFWNKLVAVSNLVLLWTRWLALSLFVGDTERRPLVVARRLYRSKTLVVSSIVFCVDDGDRGRPRWDSSFVRVDNVSDRDRGIGVASLYCRQDFSRLRSIRSPLIADTAHTARQRIRRA